MQVQMIYLRQKGISDYKRSIGGKYMKKFLSILLILIILVTLNSGYVALGSTKTTLTTRETAIAKAYVKSYESGNLSSIKKYIYPRAKITVDVVPNTTNVKVFFPEYTKKYDSKSKMDCILISCIVVVSDGTNLQVSKGTMGINLKTKSKTTYAYSKNTTLARLDEIAVSDISESQVKEIQEYLASKYGKDSVQKILYGIVEAPSATADSPADLGSTYTYDTSYSRKGDTLSGSFSITLNSVTSLTDKDLTKLGYVKNSHEVENAIYFEYKLVNVTWNAKDVKIVQFEPSNTTGYVYKRFIRPLFAGSVLTGNTDNNYNAVTFDGFDGSFQSKMDTEFKSSNLKSGSTVSLSMTGNVILPVRKDEGNYMRFSKPGVGGSYSEYLYFKLN